MWVKRVVARNVGPFGPTPDRHVDIRLVRGMIGVFGANGAGKSTLLNVIYAGITGDFGRFPAVRDKFVNHLADRDQPAYFSVEVEHGGRHLAITRSIIPNENSLVVDGGRPITKSAAIAEKVEEILGVDRALLGRFAFKGQDSIVDFIADTDAVRKKAFQVLCRTEACEEIWSLVGDFLNNDADARSEVVDDSDEIVARLAAAEADVARLAAAREAAEAKLLAPDAEKRHRRVVRLRERHDDAAEELEKARDGLPAREAKAASCEAAAASRRRKRDRLARAVGKMAGKAARAQAALAAWEDYERRSGRRHAALAAAAELDRERDAHEPPPAPPMGLSEADALNRSVVRLQSELDRARAVLSKLGKDGVTACPTCGTPVASLAAHVAEQRRVVAGHPAKIEAGLGRLAEFAAASRKAANHDKWLAGFEARRAANAKALEATEDLEAPEGSREDLEGYVESCRLKRQELEACGARLDDRVRAAAVATARLEATAARIAELEAKVAECVVSDADLAKATRRLARHAVAREEIARADGQLEEAGKRVESAKEDLRRLRARLKRAKKVRSMVRVLARARDLFHRDRLPNRVAQANLRRMEGDVNLGLESFGSPFWVETDKGLTFVVHKPGEPPQPACWLSGGQKVILAIPFWLAVGSLWQLDLGMLALDEPTAALNEKNRGLLAEALAAKTAEVRGKTQIILVTHADGLRSCFDQVVDLGG